MKYTVLLILGLFATSLASIAQTTYRWVDSNGQVHYSSNPPPSSGPATPPKTQEVRQETTATLAARLRAEEKAKQQQEQPKDKQISDKKEAADKQAAYNQAAQQKAIQDEAQLKTSCEGMRKDLATYTNYPRAKFNVEGVVRRLTQDELSTRITDLKNKINTNCQDY